MSRNHSAIAEYQIILLQSSTRLFSQRNTRHPPMGSVMAVMELICNFLFIGLD